MASVVVIDHDDDEEEETDDDTPLLSALTDATRARASTRTTAKCCDMGSSGLR